MWLWPPKACLETSNTPSWGLQLALETYSAERSLVASMSLVLKRDLMPALSIPNSSQPVVGFTGLTQLTLYDGARVSHHASTPLAKPFQIECLFGSIVQSTVCLVLVGILTSAALDFDGMLALWKDAKQRAIK